MAVNIVSVEAEAIEVLVPTIATTIVETSPVSLTVQTQGGIGVVGEIPSGLINGTNAIFTTQFSFVPETLAVYLNGIRERIIDDYQSSNGNTISFVFSPLAGERITVDYQRS